MRAHVTGHIRCTRGCAYSFLSSRYVYRVRFSKARASTCMPARIHVLVMADDKSISHTRVTHHSGMVKHAQFDELSYYRVRFGGPCCNCAATRRGGWMCVPTSKQAVSPRDKVGAAVGGLHRHDPTLSIVAQAQFQNRGGRAHGGVSLTNEVETQKAMGAREHGACVPLHGNASSCAAEEPLRRHQLHCRAPRTRALHTKHNIPYLKSRPQTVACLRVACVHEWSASSSSDECVWTSVPVGVCLFVIVD